MANTRLTLHSTKHFYDWRARCENPEEGITAKVLRDTPRTVTVLFSEGGLKDLIEDAKYYAECMGPDNTGDIDYRPAARRLLKELKQS